MAGYDFQPEMINQILGLNSFDDKNSLLLEQLRQSEALRQQPSQRHSTGLGGALGALASGIRGFAAADKENKALTGQQALINQRDAGRKSYMDLMAQALAPGPQPQQPQQTDMPDLASILGGQPAVKVPFRPKFSPTAQTQKSHDEMLLDALSGRERLADIGLASGDPVIGRLAASMLDRNDKQFGRIEDEKKRTLTQILEEKRLTADRDKQISDQEFMGKQKGLDRELTREELGLRERLAKDKAAADRMAGGDGLRKELLGNPLVKQAAEVGIAFDKMRRASVAQSAAGDMSMIFAYMKMLDPGSTVREGEYANARNAGGVPDQIINLYNKAKDGQLLNPGQRSDFMSQAGNLYEAQATPARKLYQEFSGYAQRAGLDPSQVLPDIGLGVAPSSVVPASAADISKMSDEELHRFVDGGK